MNALDKIKLEFESIDSPTLAPEETPPKPRIPRLPFLSRQVSEVSTEPSSPNEAQRRMPLPFNPMKAFPLVRSFSTLSAKAPVMREVEHLGPFGINRSNSSDAEAELSKLKWELELEDHNIGNQMEGVIEWEFDKEPRKSI